MNGKNRYYKRAKISERKFRENLRLFALDPPATNAADLCGLSIRSDNTIYKRIRTRLVDECALYNAFAGEIEVDESYFGPRRVIKRKCSQRLIKRESNRTLSCKLVYLIWFVFLDDSYHICHIQKVKFF